MALPAGLKYAGLGLMPGLHSYRFALNEHRKSSPDEMRSGQNSQGGANEISQEGCNRNCLKGWLESVVPATVSRSYPFCV